MTKRLFSSLVLGLDITSFFVYKNHEREIKMEKLKLDLLIKNGDVITNDKDKTVIKNGMIGVRNQKIEFIKQSDEDISTYEADETIDAKGMVIFPGFIDTHIHIFQSFLKGLGADHELIEWLNLSALPYGVKIL